MAEATIDRLSIEITSSSDKAVKSIDRLISSIKNLKSVSGQMTGLQQITTQLERLRKATEGMKISANIGNQLNNLSKAVSQIKHTDGDKLAALAEGLKPLSELGRSNLTSFINQLGKLPAVIGELDKADMGKFASQMRDAAAAIRPLADEMNKVAAGFSAFPSKIQKLIQDNRELTESNVNTSRSYKNLSSGLAGTVAKMTIFGYGVKRVGSSFSGFVMSASDYIETVNLFQTSMGEYYDTAFRYAELVNEKMGIDISEWMDAQGTFNLMARGFGVSADQAYRLSKGLTELSYDISSLKNLKPEEAVNKLRSALAGEIEPIRELGLSISQATLQEFALSKGIMESVSAMTEQEKALLRSVKVMEDSMRIGYVRDFAKTLEDPVNAIRILKQQISELGRTIGTVLIPIIAQVLPWVQAFVEILTDAVSSFASFVGFSMPDWGDKEWSAGLTDGSEEAEQALDGAAKAAKDLKNATIGIDELNVISPNQGGAGGGGNELSDWADNLEIPELWNEQMLENIRTKVEDIKKEIEKMLPNFEDILDLVTGIGGALLGWKIADLLLGDKLKGLARLGQLARYAAAGVLILNGVLDFARGAVDAWKNDVTFDNLADMVWGAVQATAGLGLAFGKVGVAIGLVASGVGLVIVGFRDWIKNGDTSANLKAIGIGVAFIGAAAVMLQNKLLLVITAVSALGMLFLHELPKISGYVNVGIEGAKNLAGAFMNAVLGISAVFNNLLFDIADTAKGIWEVAKDLGHNMFAALHNSFIAIAQAFTEMASGILKGLRNIGQQIENMVGFFNVKVDLTSGLDRWISALETDKSRLEADKLEYKTTEDMLASFKQGFEERDKYDVDQFFHTFDAFQTGWVDEAYAAGEQFGQMAQDYTRAFLGEVFGVETEGIADGIKSEAAALVDSLSALTAAFDTASATGASLASPAGEYQAATDHYNKMLEEFSSRSASFDNIDFTAGLENLNTTLSSDLIDLTQTLDTGVSGLDTQLASLSDLTSADTQNTVDLFGERSNWLNQFNSGLTNLENTLSENQIESLDTNFSSLKALNTDNTGYEINTLNANTSDVKAAIANAASRIVASTDQIRINIYNSYGMGGMGFASGGFPEPSQLFYAREGGVPELVGRIGNQTAVANNDQIINGIRAGVAEANAGTDVRLDTLIDQMERLIAKSGVKLDGKTLKAAVDRAGRQSGVSIMSGGVR